jgi:undecaprenyl-diphosphatase
MSAGLPGERRLLEWVGRQTYDSPLRGRLHALETGVPYGGAALVYCLLGLLALRRREDRRPALVAAAAGVLGWVASDAVKLLVERSRPCIEGHACGGHSFPEGPGTVLVAIAVAIWPHSRAVALVAGVCALADATAQLAYGSHWPSDLLGAWALGAACGCAALGAASARAARSRGE